MIVPPFLKKGDKVAIVSPASAVNPDYVDAACRMLSEWGYIPVPGKHCKGRNGYYSGTAYERLSDLKEAMLEPEIKAILCGRGGYGSVHLVEHLPLEMIRSCAKWIIGFSDISVLHALFNRAGVSSIHASMAKHMYFHGIEDRCNMYLRDILQGEPPTYKLPGHEFNRLGTAQGMLAGGNLAVLGGLSGTDYDMLKGDRILFIEDIAEPIYKVERILYNLRLSGVLQRLKGLIVGQFTQYDEPDSAGETMYGMIKDMTASYTYPIAFDFPIGHVDRNYPLIIGVNTTLTVNKESISLSF